MSTILRTSTHGVSEMCCTWLAGNTGCKKSPKIRHLGTIAQLCRAASSQLRNVSTIGKNLLNNNTSSRCARYVANFGPLTTDISSGVWGTPANFNGFRILAALLHDTSSGHQPNFAALNRGHHLYLAGWPLRWALAHILMCYIFRATEVIFEMPFNRM